MDDSFVFSDAELMDQLRQLNYSDVSMENLQAFKKELKLATSRHLFNNTHSDIVSPISLTNTTPTVDSSSLNVSPTLLSKQNQPQNAPVMLNSNSSLQFDEDLDSILLDSEDRFSKLSLSNSTTVSSARSSAKLKKPLKRKTARKVCGQSINLTEPRSDDSQLSNQSIGSFKPVAAYQSSENSDISSINFSTPMKSLNDEFSSLSCSYLSSDVSSIQISNKNSIVSIEKIPKNELDLSVFTNSVGVDDSVIHRRLSGSTSSLKRSRSCDDINIVKYPSKSFIRPPMRLLRSQKARRADPVQRYHEYQQYWDTYKTPGEKSHKNLRWMVREHMMSDPSDRRRNVEHRSVSLEHVRNYPMPWRS